MATPPWLDPAAKVAEMVGAAAGVAALVFDVLDRGRPDHARSPLPRVSARAPRGWLRLAAALFCVPLLVLILQLTNVPPPGLRTVTGLIAGLGAVAACAAIVVYITSMRRQRIPLPDALRALIDRQWEAAQHHTYEYSMGAVPPLLDIYVEQLAERLPSAAAIGGVGRAGRLTLPQMLAQHRNVVLLAEPGVGKSTAVAKVIWEQCAWLRRARRAEKVSTAPYGPVIPIALPADLHGCISLPGAMAAEWQRLTDIEPDSQMFEQAPPHAEAWLIMIDGIDQILGTQVRKRVLEKLAAWIAEESPYHRFMITTRPLLDGELGYLKIEYASHFRLRKFDSAGLRRFAEQWVATRERRRILELESEPITVSQFLAGVNSSSLAALAQVPLLATITALILESRPDGKREETLPTSRDAIYERYVQHLFASRQLDEHVSIPPQAFSVHGKAGDEAWAWLCGNLRGLLEGIADLRLSRQRPGVIKCAEAWVRSKAPVGMFVATPGWEDALDALLVATSLIVPSHGGLDFAHPSFAEYLAAGPRAQDFELDTWLADALSPQSRNLALFVLGRRSREAPGVPDTVVELLLDRSSSDACIAGEIVADGIEVSPELRQRVVDHLFTQLTQDDIDTSAALLVLIDLAADSAIRRRLIGFAEELRQPEWVRAEVAEKLSDVVPADGVRLLRQVLEDTADSWLSHRILLKLDNLDEATSGERDRAREYESAALAPVPTSFGAQAGEWYKRVAGNPANSPGQRLRAALAMAERRDADWAVLFGDIIVDPDLTAEIRLESGHRIMQLDEADGVAALRRVTEWAQLSLDVRVPLLAAMAGERDELARQVLNELARRGGASFAECFPQLDAWREEIGTRSSEQEDAYARAGVVSDFAANAQSPVPGAPGEVAAIWGNVPSRNRFFSGREEIFQVVRDMLVTAAVKVVPVAIVGLGGGGKTQVAVEYAWRHRTEYDLVWWIPADQPALVRSSLAALALHLNLPTASASGIEGAAASVLDALRRGEPYRRWLLIFDHADQPEDLKDILPRGPGDVLVTSRNHRWADVAEMVGVDMFTRLESLDFLRGRLLRGISEPDADRLANELGDLPLALEQAAALQAEAGMSVEEYLRRVKDNTSGILAEGKSPEYPLSMTAAWKLSVLTLAQQLPAAMDLLRCCAFFGPAPIPRRIFQGSAATTGSSLASLLNDPIALARALRELGRFALAKFDGSMIVVHRLIQALVREDLDRDEQARYRHEAQLLLAAAAPTDPEDPAQWPQFSELAPHIAPAGIADCRDESVRAFALNAVRYLRAAGHPGSALELAQSLLATAGTGAVTTRVRRHAVAALRELGRFREAAEEEVTLLPFGSPDPETDEPFLSAEALGQGFRIAGQFAVALSHDLDVLHGAQEVFGAGDPRTIPAAGNVALDLTLMTQFQEARDLLAPVYATSAMDHAPGSLRYWNDLARVVRLSGDYTGGRDISERVHASCQHRLGTGHPQTLQAARDLAVACRLCGDYQASRVLAEETLNGFLKIFGPDHPDTLATAVALQQLLRLTSQADESLELAVDTSARYANVFGNDHPFSLGCSGNLAVLYRRRGDPAAARRLNSYCLARLEEAVGIDHCYALAVATNLASDFAALGKIDVAIELGEATRTGWRAQVGEKHPDTASCEVNLAIDTAVRNGETGNGQRLDCDFDPPRI